MKRLIICAICNETKEHCAHGLCRPCYLHRWEKQHHKERRAYQRQWRKQNPDKAATYCRRYREAHPNRRRQYYEAHREEILIYNRLYYQEHRNISRPRWNALRRRYYWEHTDKERAYIRRWRRENPEKRVAQMARRYARKGLLPDTLTPEQAEQLFAIGKVIYPGEELHLDHIVPLSKGGGTTFANMHVIPASLNCSKQDKLPQEIYQQAQLELLE